MKFVLLLAVGLGACLAVPENIFVPLHGIRDPDPPHERARAVSWLSITQPLDNFDPNNSRTWQMRAIQNDQFYKPGGPIFIMIGAEWTIDPGWLQSGNMFLMAQEHNGMQFYTEHRCYGKSQPNGDLTTNSLKYCTTDQALADLANFCQYLKQTYPGSKIVVVGGSYAGTMAIWMREKYPNLIHAAVSSSAPLLAIVDFFQYYEVVATAMTPTTNDIILNGVMDIVNRLNNGMVQQVSRDFNLCQTLNMNDPNEVYYFFLMIMGKFGGQIQYADQYTPDNIERDLLNTGATTAYGKLSRYVPGGGCMPDYRNFVGYFGQTGLNIGDTRSWIYQTCTQYGFFQTTTSNNQPFGHTCPVDLFLAWCRDLFGQQFTSQVVSNGVAQTNANYGGLHPQTSRVVSVHGSWDPWHSIGLPASNDPNMPVYLVDRSAHTADLSGPSQSDPPGLRDAKVAVRTHIRTWLKEP